MSHHNCPISCLLTCLPPAIREREVQHLVDIAKTYRLITGQTSKKSIANWFEIYTDWQQFNIIKEGT
jgi:hypothetical protein